MDTAHQQQTKLSQTVWNGLDCRRFEKKIKKKQKNQKKKKKKTKKKTAKK